MNERVLLLFIYFLLINFFFFWQYIFLFSKNLRWDWDTESQVSKVNFVCLIVLIHSWKQCYIGIVWWFRSKMGTDISDLIAYFAQQWAYKRVSVKHYLIVWTGPNNFSFWFAAITTFLWLHFGLFNNIIIIIITIMMIIVIIIIMIMKIIIIIIDIIIIITIIIIIIII